MTKNSLWTPRGAKFLDDFDKVSEKLLRKIDSICSQIPGFYYGRMDVLFTSFEKLSIGKNFSIIEINGAGSEPTHIYDPRYSLFFPGRKLSGIGNCFIK